MKFSLIGNGFISPRHIKAIQSIGGEIVGRDCGEDYISILTPNDTHFKYCLEEAKKGKIVLCEKPLAITVKDVEELTKYENIFVVLQLRYHPTLKEIRVLDYNNIEMNISVHRENNYFKGWQGDEKRSGGIVFNLGIHYFDLLFYLFGYPTEFIKIRNEENVAEGILIGKKYRCRWKLSTEEPVETQKRVFKINGNHYNFSSKDNLSQEDLHRFVYKDLIEGKGVRAKDVIKLTETICSSIQ